MAIDKHPTLLGDYGYEIKYKFPAGSSSVYRVKNKQGDDLVAKLTDTSLVSEELFTQPEVEDILWNKHKFDFFIPVYDYFLDADEDIYSVNIKPYLDGPTPDRRLFNSPSKISVEIGRQIDILHDAGLTRVDVRPSNYKWDDCRIKMVDYGTLKPSEDIIEFIDEQIEDLINVTPNEMTGKITLKPLKFKKYK